MTDLFGAPPEYLEQDGYRWYREDLVELKQKSDATGFDAFWANVPGGPDSFKIGKEEARKAFSRLKADDKQSAINSVAMFYKHWRRAHPDAAKLHPVRFLSMKRWEDEGWSEATKTPQAKSQDRMSVEAANVKSGKPFLCTHISGAMARAMLEEGLVTGDELDRAGVEY